MTDVVDQATRSRMMSRIRGKDTKPEILLRKALHARGFRYRMNVRGLPGSPDIVLPKWSCVIQVHGCYWHRHPGCPKATTPASNVEFWTEKFEANVRRDRAALARIQDMGWRTAVVWECAIGSKVRDEIVAALERFLREGGHDHLEIGKDGVAIEHISVVP
ncbi:very short patch repair endonuclease [Limimaricola cinnabarinus]|uniref:very short patch repair endonuclease n=1 Tax=Limimaricola cinnabarinus TaxID=1125964 RepID=UPI002492E0E5|nr:DNA mismatch endonuclease Vsr [Limimaricola cinnabarinus]